MVDRNNFYSLRIYICIRVGPRAKFRMLMTCKLRQCGDEAIEQTAKILFPHPNGKSNTYISNLIIDFTPCCIWLGIHLLTRYHRIHPVPSYINKLLVMISEPPKPYCYSISQNFSFFFAVSAAGFEGNRWQVQWQCKNVTHLRHQNRHRTKFRLPLWKTFKVKWNNREVPFSWILHNR